MADSKQEQKKDLTGCILGCGNPLLDISAEVEPEMLTKYDVKLNNAILAEGKHMPMYEELVSQYNPEYIAGGATQNSIRVAQWMLQAPGATSYIGCVGKDKYGKQLRASAEADGVAVYYQEDEKTPTGTCACLIVKKERSLIANLGAANNFKIDHLLTEEVTPVWTKANYVYIAGFFLTVSPPSIQHLAKHCFENNKTFMMNLAAPFIPQFFGEPLLAAMPYVDILFGNESECESFGKANNISDTTIVGIMQHIASMPKQNAERPRVVVITQGAGDTVVVENGKVSKFAVPKITAEEIVDCNGAGDAFVGGFISQLVQGAPIERCVEAGHYAAGFIIRTSGTKLVGKPDFK